MSNKSIVWILGVFIIAFALITTLNISVNAQTCLFDSIWNGESNKSSFGKSIVTLPKLSESNYELNVSGVGEPTYSQRESEAKYNISQVNTCSWTGDWSTPWGVISLVEQNPTNVVGTYEHKNGRIDGIKMGNQLQGTWSQKPTYSPASDAGQFIFTISPNCRSFKGDWRYGYAEHGNSWRHDWNGQKL